MLQKFLAISFFTYHMYGGGKTWKHFPHHCLFFKGEIVELTLKLDITGPLWGKYFGEYTGHQNICLIKDQ